MVSMMNVSKEYEVITELMMNIKRNYFPFREAAYSNVCEIMSKGTRDLVTSLDYELEKLIIDHLKRYFPKDHIVSEETNPHTQVTGRTWIIDPLDGTCNYANGIPVYGVQLVLLEEKEPILSFIMHPVGDELYYAEKGKGAFLNGNSIKVKKDIPVDQSILTLGDFSKSNFESRDKQIELMSQLNDKVLKFRMWGSACYDLAYLAAGRTQGHIMFSKNLWDILPGLLLVREAGAFIANIEGRNFDLEKGTLVATANEELLNLILYHAASDRNTDRISLR